jgi:hypothetical protein
VREARASACPLTQHDDLRLWRAQRLSLGTQGYREVLRQGPRLPATSHPGQRQRSAWVDYVDHQRHATPDDQHQRLSSKLSPQARGIRDKRALGGAVGVVAPLAKRLMWLAGVAPSGTWGAPLGSGVL